MKYNKKPYWSLIGYVQKFLRNSSENSMPKPRDNSHTFNNRLCG